MPEQDSPCIGLAEVLKEEFEYVNGEAPPLQDNASLADEAREKQLRTQMFHQLYDRKQTALCLSGGGIRSATFALGVIQGLARCGLLDKFHYLSTVSGGGYIGSWLTSWIHRQGLGRVVDLLRKDGSQGEEKDPLSGEPKTIGHLRQYSNYLSPRLGLLSADTWTLVATVLRNLLLNWTVLIPLMFAALLVPRILVAALNNQWLASQKTWLFALAVLLGLISLTYTMVFRPSDQEYRQHRTGLKKRETQGSFLRWCLLPLSGACLLMVMCWAWWRQSESGKDLECLSIPWVPGRGTWNFALFGIEMVLVAGLLSWLILRKWQNPNREKTAPPENGSVDKGVLRKGTMLVILREVLALAVSGLVGWLLVWAIAHGFTNPLAANTTLYVCVALPLMLAALFLAMALFVGFSSRRVKVGKGYRDIVSDEDREWLARFCAWVFIVGFAWLFVSALVLFGPYGLLWLTENSAVKKAVLTAIGGTSGIITWVLGFGSKTAPNAQKRDTGGWRENALSLAAPVFLILLLVGIGLGTNWILFQSTKLPSAATPVNCDMPATSAMAVPSSDASSGNAASAPPAATSMSVGECVKHLWKDSAATSQVSVAVCLRHLVKVDTLDGKLPRAVAEDGSIAAPQFAREAQLTIARWASARILLALLMVALAISLGMGCLINVNRFSLHAMYRNRLIRAYLGASRKNRRPNPFTGFDPHDNFPLYELRGHCRCKNNHVMNVASPVCEECGAEPNREIYDDATIQKSCDGHLVKQNGRKQHRLLHIVNMALNLVHDENLAWQERKAESFTASPLHCGSFEVGYRDSRHYAEGLSLGTAVAISGAAVSPNMGYHSSPVVTFLLTLYNARLGWWLGNPRRDSTTWQKAHPTYSVRPIVDEALGLTDDQNPYIYLSDGGHFENLGLYEMVLRRCQYIVVSDAGCDPSFSFDDLGNAIRKIRIDMGVQIQMDPRINILPRADKKAGVYCALGKINYTGVDGTVATTDKDGKTTENERVGWLIYLKPAFYNQNEPVDVVNYAKTCSDFPHETTADQFFSETQFESYRKLGLYAVEQISGKDPFVSFEEFKENVGKYVKPVPIQPTPAP